MLDRNSNHLELNRLIRLNGVLEKSFRSHDRLGGLEFALENIQHRSSLASASLAGGSTTS